MLCFWFMVFCSYLSRFILLYTLSPPRYPMLHPSSPRNPVPIYESSNAPIPTPTSECLTLHTPTIKYHTSIHLPTNTRSSNTRPPPNQHFTTQRTLRHPTNTPPPTKPSPPEQPKQKPTATALHPAPLPSHETAIPLQVEEAVMEGMIRRQEEGMDLRGVRRLCRAFFASFIFFRIASFVVEVLECKWDRLD